MKYLSVKPIVVALHRILDASNTKEHRTGTGTSGLLQNYFPINGFVTTPEQIQESSNKRPDFSVERLENDKLVPHVFVEVKSIVNSENFDDILDQLETAVLETVDLSGGKFTIFIFAMKGVKAAFLEYHTFQSLLDENGIVNYKGFIPLNYNIPEDKFFNINENSQPVDYFIYENRTSVPTEPEQLRALGVESSSKIKHPYI
jgi:hypothetical protein